MIRMWHGFTRADRLDRYLPELLARGLKEILDTNGNQAIQILTRRCGTGVEIVFASGWSSREAAERFPCPETDNATLTADGESLFDNQFRVVYATRMDADHVTTA